MKKIYLLMMLLATAFVACSDDDDDKDDDNGTPWEIKIGIKISWDDRPVFLGLSGTMPESIDWGDAHISNGEPNFDYDEVDEDDDRDYGYTHEYSKGNYTITIKGKGEVRLSCGSDNPLTFLDLSKCSGAY